MCHDGRSVVGLPKIGEDLGMASSDSGSHGAGTGATSSGNFGPAAVKIPFFKWGSRKYFFFIEFQTRRYHQRFVFPAGKGPSPPPPQQGQEGFAMMMASAPRDNEGDGGSTGTVEIQQGSTGIGVGFGWEETNGVSPPGTGSGTGKVDPIPPP
jgi:hypothetical protein